ncbi:MAG: LA2681 family HEPN domain-containing protein [Nitrospirae bacterium]|nr:LA2681 family HEPN domain-containing protein [Nitrospirota bacterium]
MGMPILPVRDEPMEKAESLYKSLVSTENLDGLSNEEALQLIERLTDLSWDLRRDEGLKRAIFLGEELRNRSLDAQQQTLSHYYSANAWAGLAGLIRKGTDAAWDWEQEEIEKEIFHLRSALQLTSHCKLPDERVLQILTNLGNLMSNIGRFVEAHEYWDRALSIRPSFGMARGNRGYGLTSYAFSLYDKGHTGLFLKHAHTDLKKALSEPLEEDARSAFEKCVAQIEAMADSKFLTRETDLQAFSLGASRAEKEYRKWCLEKRLFLNPLNDLGPYPIAAQDILTTPGIVVKIGEGPYYPGFFNQMKQEFVSARFLYYEGATAKLPHFSDSRVFLYNTLDYPSYSLSTEKMKAAYRMIYSLFDKMAFFLNCYLSFSIPERQINFKTFWYADQKKKNALRPDLGKRQNWPLRGLFWLSKDLYEDNDDFKATMEPDARALYEIRNHLEHKYLKLHDYLWHGPSKEYEALSRGLTDTMAYSIYRSEFQEKTLRLIKMARAALIYLSLAIHCEELDRSKKKGHRITVPMYLDKWEDKWKI